MLPRHPFVEAAAGLLFAAAVPVCLWVCWTLWVRWRKNGMPPSRIPELRLGQVDWGFFLLVSSLLVVSSRTLVHVAMTVWVVAFLAWKQIGLRTLWGGNVVTGTLSALPRACVGYLALLPFIAAGMLLSMGVGRLFGLDPDMQAAVKLFLEAGTPQQVAGFLLLACVAAPVGEEIVFRGFLLPALKPVLGRAGAIALTSVLFGAAHVHWASFLSLTLLGGVLALIYETTGKLAHAIALHMVFNTVTCGLLLAVKYLPAA